MLRPEKLEELTLRDESLKRYYVKQNNGFYKVKPLDSAEKDILKQKFKGLGFSALNFTDSRSSYQFYNLSRLWNDIQIALDANLTLWHPATEPISAGELYEYLTGETFVNEIAAMPAKYDYKTIHAELFGGQNGYVDTKENVKKQIKEFVEGK